MTGPRLKPELTELQATALNLREQERLNYTQMGERMGVTKSSARKAHLTAVRKREVFGPRIDDDLDRRFTEWRKAINGVTDETFVSLLEEGTLKALWLLVEDEAALKNLSGKELSTVAGNLLEKRQLLRGEPTAITRFEDIKKLDEVAELLNAELQRRGKLIDVTPEKVE